jgi:hypothetical protein
MDDSSAARKPDTLPARRGARRAFTESQECPEAEGGIDSVRHSGTRATTQKTEPQSQAGQSQAGQSQAGQSQAGQSQAGQYRAGQYQAGAFEPHQNEAHAEMLRAVERGECVVFVDVMVANDVRVQKSAWALGDGDIQLTTWCRSKVGHWELSRSCDVRGDGVRQLARLVLMAAERKSRLEETRRLGA